MQYFGVSSYHLFIKTQKARSLNSRIMDGRQNELALTSNKVSSEAGPWLIGNDFLPSASIKTLALKMVNTKHIMILAVTRFHRCKIWGFQ